MLIISVLLLCSLQGPIWPLLPPHTAETLKAIRLSVTETNNDVKSTVLMPSEPVDSVIPATRLTSASNKAANLHRVSIGDNGGGKFHCFEFVCKDKEEIHCSWYHLRLFSSVLRGVLMIDCYECL
jgi:hypothetical protein